MSNKNKSKVYLHINNGGIYFDIENKDSEFGNYPILNIGASHFKCKTNGMSIPMNPKRLKAIGEWFINESEKAEKDYWVKDFLEGHDIRMSINGVREDQDELDDPTKWKKTVHESGSVTYSKIWDDDDDEFEIILDD